MKIGVLLSAYNSEDYIDECLKPWMELKEDFDNALKYLKKSFKIYFIIDENHNE